MLCPPPSEEHQTPLLYLEITTKKDVLCCPFTTHLKCTDCKLHKDLSVYVCVCRVHNIMVNSPLRLRKLKERRKPVCAVGSLGSASPVSWANSSPGRSMSLVMLLRTSSVNTWGRSCFRRSTKKSGLKMTSCGAGS